MILAGHERFSVFVTRPTKSLSKIRCNAISITTDAVGLRRPINAEEALSWREVALVDNCFWTDVLVIVAAFAVSGKAMSVLHP
jgi:hypothetical protein